MTFTQQRILEAIARGYTITEDGIAYGPKGRLAAKSYGKQRYPTISTNWDGRVFGIPVHMLAAYIFYGLESFNPNLIIRHLDANTNNFAKSNIVLGTHSQNQQDKPKEIRIAAAKAARAAQGISSLIAKLDEKAVLEIRDYYSALNGKKAPNGATKALADKYGISTTVLFNVKNGKSYAHY